MNATRLLAATFLLLPFHAPAQKQDGRTPVLVELFTSEGCSSCPPADALLAKLDQQPIAGAEIIVLGEHVDYWDQLGWRDRFSSHQYTERQGQYSTHFHLNDVYTPQMVVNGNAQFVGNDERAATRAIADAARGKTYKLFLTDTRLDQNRFSARVRLRAGVAGMAPSNELFGVPPNAEFYAALVSPQERTAVRSGENGGRTLSHVGVVRSLVRIGDTAAFLKAALDVSLDTGHLSGPLRVVVFAQSEGSGAILGAVSMPLAAAPRESMAGAHETR